MNKYQFEKVSVKLTFSIDDILSSIRNLSFVQWDVAAAEIDAAKELIADILEDANVPRVNEIITVAIRECEQTLFSFVKQEAADGEVIGDSTPTGTYEIDMLVPKGYSRTTLQSIRDLIKEYVVCRVLQDWIGIVNPPLSVGWAERSNRMLSQIETEANGSVPPYKRRVSPL